MNDTVKDLLLIIVIVVLCLSVYIGKEEMEKVNGRLIFLECEIRSLSSHLKDIEDTCDGRFEYGVMYWDNDGIRESF